MSGWRSPYTLSFSAINTWVGEELRTIGAEYSLDWLGRSHGHDFDFTLSAAGYGWNDTAGTVLATRGWGLTDRQSTLFGRFANGGKPLPQRTLFYDDLDKRAGYYASAAANYRGLLELRALHYDNRAKLVEANRHRGRHLADLLRQPRRALDPGRRTGRSSASGCTGAPTKIPDHRTTPGASTPNSCWAAANAARCAIRHVTIASAPCRPRATFQYIGFYLADDGHAWTLAATRS